MGARQILRLLALVGCVFVFAARTLLWDSCLDLGGSFGHLTFTCRMDVPSARQSFHFEYLYEAFLLILFVGTMLKRSGQNEGEDHQRQL